jgi:hypothetical protein
MSHKHALQVSSATAGPVLTPAQKRFNTLVRQIQQARGKLTSWGEASGPYRQSHAEIVVPLQSELTALRRQWVLALDALLSERRWTKAERETMRDIVCSEAGDLLMVSADDEPLKAVFATHAGVDFETERQQMVLAMKDLTEAMTGLDLGDDEGLDTDDDLMHRLREGMQEQASAAQAQRDAHAARRRKTPAQQQRREAEAQQATQSVREIYRKLASALHPDRETDAQQREAKTELMQRVNQAYEANDLLALLELQLQIEQIDESHIANASAERLKHYNRVLSEQLANLKAEIDRVEMDFCMEFGVEPGLKLDPQKLGRVLEQCSREVLAELADLRRDMSATSDVAVMKRWLKRHREAVRESEFFDPFEMF